MEAGVPLGEFWAIGKTGQEHVPALAFPLPRPQDVSPCACSLLGPEFGGKVQRPRLLPAPGRMLLPLQACRRAAPSQHSASRRAARRGLPRQIKDENQPTSLPVSDQRSRKAAQSGLAFLLLWRPDARSPIATAAYSNGRPARAGPSAQAREGAAPRLPFAPSVLRK